MHKHPQQTIVFCCFFALHTISIQFLFFAQFLKQKLFGNTFSFETSMSAIILSKILFSVLVLIYALKLFLDPWW